VLIPPQNDDPAARKLRENQNYSALYTPRRSKAEMEVLAGLKNIRTVQLSVGKLAIHEEFPDLVASAILEFLVGDRGQEAEGSEGTVAER